MIHKRARITWLLAGTLAAATAGADYLAPDPGTRISIQYNSSDALVVRPIGGVWTHPSCPDLRGAVLARSHFRKDLLDTHLEFDEVWGLLVQAAMNGRSVNLLVSDTLCHANGYPLIESLRVFP